MRTPGYWEAVDINEDETIAIVPIMTDKEFIHENYGTKNEGIDIAHCYGPDRIYNASLISAAPMLATAIDTILRKGLTKKTRKKAVLAINLARRKPGYF